MRAVLSIVLMVVALASFAKEETGGNPLARFSTEWADAKYKVCNTAAATPYLSGKEKEVLYVLNMARMNPQLFCKTVLPHAGEISSFINMDNEYYYKSLVKQMASMEPLPILKPDDRLYKSALCHVTTTGKTGYVGHDRKTAECRKAQHYSGECCQYGIDDPLGIILNLLVDENVESLGHRNICLGSRYTKMSPSYGPHKQYGSITVLDFD